MGDFLLIIIIVLLGLGDVSVRAEVWHEIVFRVIIFRSYLMWGSSISHASKGGTGWFRLGYDLCLYLKIRLANILLAGISSSAGGASEGVTGWN